MRNWIDQCSLEEAFLTELSRPNSLDKAEWILVKAGYKKLGAGANGSVWQGQDKDYVLKVFSSKDQAYLAFIEYAQKNPNPHLPKFFKKPVKVTDGVYAIRTELLTHSYFRTISNYIEEYLVHRAYRTIDPPSDVMEYMNANPLLKEACDGIAQLAKSNYKFMIDMHSNNIMSRDGTIVITDPIGI